MNTLNKLALSAVLTLGFTSFVSAAPILDEILSEYPAVYDNHGSYVQLTDTDLNNDDVGAGLILESAGFAGRNSFGIFKYGDSDKRVEVFNGEAAPGDDRVTLTFKADGSVWIGTSEQESDFGSVFGFYLKRGESIFYSDRSLNDGIDYAGFYDLEVAKNGYNFVVAFEDLPPQSDEDFNDLVVGLSDVVTVSEPETLALLGIGLVGLSLAGRRRKG